MYIGSYLDLITSRNSTKPKYMDFVETILDHPIEMGAVTDSFLFAFDIENAAGVQLDTIGTLVGVSRLLNFIPTLGNREMNDDEYRMMIKLKIARNIWDGRNDPILSIYQEIFPRLNINYIDNQNMTITLYAQGEFTVRESEILASSGLILVPAGVGFTVVTYGGETGIIVYSGVNGFGEITVDKAHVKSRKWGWFVSHSQMGSTAWIELLDEWWSDLERLLWENLMPSHDTTWEEVGEMTWSEVLQPADI